MNRSDRLDSLMKMLPAQFEEIVFRLDIPAGFLPGTNTPLSIRAIEVLRYLDGQGRSDELDALLSAARAPAPEAHGRRPEKSELAKVRCFIEFAPQDRSAYEKLSRHLKVLQRSRGDLEIWSKAQITPGMSWQSEIDRRLAEADIVILLLSSGFLGSDESYGIAERSFDTGRALVIPVLASACAWQETFLGRYRALPRNGQPLAAWRNQDEALVEVAQAIGAAANSLIRGQSQSSGGETVGAAEAPLPETRAPQSNPSRQKINILFLASAPTDLGRSQVGREAREIDDRLRNSSHRDRFHLDQAWAVTPADLSALLLRHRPTIAHFSGHGRASEGLVFERSDGQSAPVPAGALGRLFEILGPSGIQIVILNACYSTPQAVEIARAVEFVVGISDSISDEAARAFSTGFYTALAAGQTVRSAFDLGTVQIALMGLSGAERPQLHVRRGSDASRSRLV